MNPGELVIPDRKTLTSPPKREEVAKLLSGEEQNLLPLLKQMLGDYRNETGVLYTLQHRNSHNIQPIFDMLMDGTLKKTGGFLIRTFTSPASPDFRSVAELPILEGTQISIVDLQNAELPEAGIYIDKTIVDMLESSNQYVRLANVIWLADTENQILDYIQEKGLDFEYHGDRFESAINAISRVKQIIDSIAPPEYVGEDKVI